MQAARKTYAWCRTIRAPLAAILLIAASHTSIFFPVEALASSIDSSNTTHDIMKMESNSIITLASAAPIPSSDMPAASADTAAASSPSSLSDVSHLLQKALADQSKSAASTSVQSASTPSSYFPAPMTTQSSAAPDALSDTSQLLQKALAEQAPAPMPNAIAPVQAPPAVASLPPTLASTPPPPAPSESAAILPIAVPSTASAKLTPQEASAVQADAKNQAPAPPAARSALVAASPATTVLADEPKDKQPTSMENTKLTLQQEVTAQSVTAPSNSSTTDSIKTPEAALNGQLTPSERIVKSDMTGQWAEKMEILEQENVALRDKLQIMRPDSLSDIRVDVVTQIREDVLRARLSELEQEVNKLHMEKDREKESADGVPPVKASSLNPKGQAIPPPPPAGQTPAVMSKPLLTTP